MPRCVIVVPCYNEANRLPVAQFLHFARCQADVHFLFVNDGSSDGTCERLDRLRLHMPGRFSVSELRRNVGKAQAVRHGCLAAFATGAEYVGYWDADLATPLNAIPEFLQVLDNVPALELVCGARVCLLGRAVNRQQTRHYLGRLFATAASWTLGVKIYDTQCGAKLFRASPLMQLAFSRPFGSRWLFDVEILVRLITLSRVAGTPTLEKLVYELPLREWNDVKGSKVRATDFAKAFLELMQIRRRYSRPEGVFTATELATLRPPVPLVIGRRRAA